MKRIISNVRQRSNAGWFIGGVVFSNDNVECWDKVSGYYPTEEILNNLYPNSLSIEDACVKAKQHRWISWDF